MSARHIADLAGTRRSQFRILPDAAAGAPTTGYHAEGEIHMDANKVPWRCTVSGTPGTWISMAGGSVAWGAISGDIEDQADLASALLLNAIIFG